MLGHFICVCSYSVSHQPSSFHCIGSCASKVKVGQKVYKKCQLAPECCCIGSRHVNTQCQLSSHGGSKWSECWLSKKIFEMALYCVAENKSNFDWSCPNGIFFCFFSQAYVILNRIQVQKCSNKLWQVKQHRCKTHTNVCLWEWHVGPDTCVNHLCVLISKSKAYLKNDLVIWLTTLISLWYVSFPLYTWTQMVRQANTHTYTFSHTHIHAHYTGC